jgi:hypothetical protein
MGPSGWLCVALMPETPAPYGSSHRCEKWPGTEMGPSGWLCVALMPDTRVPYGISR